jgi:predicted RNA binding protein YcfA (HicA-like mRNA interferase family)
MYTAWYTSIVASEMRFSEVRRMLEAKGYRLDRIKGSHHIFVKPGVVHQSVPVHHGKVKPYYVRQIERL